jgi:hypothetical protein
MNHTPAADFLTSVCPCDGCPNRQRCSDEHLACARFVGFMADEPAKAWRLALRAPTAAIYQATLGDRPKRRRGRPIKPAPPRQSTNRRQAVAPDAARVMAMLKVAI